MNTSCNSIHIRIDIRQFSFLFALQHFRLIASINLGLGHTCRTAMNQIAR